MWLDVVLFLSLRLCHVHLRCVERAGAFGLPPPLEGRNQNKTPYPICDLASASFGGVDGGHI